MTQRTKSKEQVVADGTDTPHTPPVPRHYPSPLPARLILRLQAFSLRMVKPELQGAADAGVPRDSDGPHAPNRPLLREGPCRRRWGSAPWVDLRGC